MGNTPSVIDGCRKLDPEWTRHGNDQLADTTITIQLRLAPNSVTNFVNPFVAFLIFVPLLLTLLLWAGAILWTIDHGLTGGAIAMNLIFAAISAALIYLLFRTSRGSVLDDEEIRDIDAGLRRKFTHQILAVVYITLFLLLLLLTGLETVRNWLGVASAIFALSIVFSAVLELKRTKVIPPETLKQLSATELHRRELLLSSYSRTRNWLLVSSVVTALLTIWLFRAFDGGRFISVFDLWGALVLLTSVVFWFITKEISFRRRS